MTIEQMSDTRSQLDPVRRELRFKNLALQCSSNVHLRLFRQAFQLLQLDKTHSRSGLLVHIQSLSCRSQQSCTEMIK